MDNLYLKSNLLFAGQSWDHLFARHGRPAVVADGLRNPENMGALIRLADNVGASEVVFLGSADKVNLTRVRRVAASSAGNLPWKFVQLHEWLARLAPDVQLVAVETTLTSSSIFETQLPDHPVFVLGNEVHGVSAEVLGRAVMSVHIPVPGPTRSLNVSHAAAVALFEWLRQKTHSFNPTEHA